MSTILSCVGRAELNWNTVIQLQSTYQFHPEACDKLCSSLVSDSGEIKIPPLQQGAGCSAAGCAGREGGREGCPPAVCTGTRTLQQQGGQPHGGELAVVTSGVCLAVFDTVHKCLESTRRRGAEWPPWRALRAGGSRRSWAAPGARGIVCSSPCEPLLVHSILAPGAVKFKALMVV